MLSISEAKNKILKNIKEVEKITIPLLKAHKMVLADPVFATIDSPSFSNSSMDGFALISNNTELASKDKPAIFNIVGEVPAGVKPSMKLKDGEAVRIMTGAMIPENADAVIPVEKTNLTFDDISNEKNVELKIYEKIKRNDYIRKRGEDFKVGDLILEKGIVLRPQDLSALSMMGFSNPEVFRKPRVALFSSGDELVPVEDDLIEGKIRETNSYALSALIESCGGEVINLGIAKDNEKDIERKLAESKNLKVDLIISTAGVSAGIYDYVRKVIEKNGTLKFWKVNMRPGKPLAFGDYKGIPIIGLPGNPVSAFVSFEVFVRDVIKSMRGEKIVPRKKYKAILLENINSDGRESFLRAVVEICEEKTFAQLESHQGSGNIFSLVKANSLLLVPAGIFEISAGEIIEYWNI